MKQLSLLRNRRGRGRPTRRDRPTRHSRNAPKRAARAGKTSRVAHRTRPEHRKHDPVLVTLRMKDGLPSLRHQAVLALLRRIFGEPRMPRFQAVHYSVQANHVHLIAEADDKARLSSGLRSLIIRIAKRLNQMLDRKGGVLADRYHRRDLASPREVRNALRYVLQNWKKHGHVRAEACFLDAFSSALGLDAWAGFEDLLRALPAERVREARPREPWTWLLRRGWQRAGPLDVFDAPAAGAA